MPPGERNPDLRGAALWTADVQQPESKFLRGRYLFLGSWVRWEPLFQERTLAPNFPSLGFLTEGQEMQQDQEIPGTGQVYLCRMFKHEEIPAQVLRFLRGWPVLHAPADQDGEDALPL